MFFSVILILLIAIVLRKQKMAETGQLRHIRRRTSRLVRNHSLLVFLCNFLFLDRILTFGFYN